MKFAALVFFILLGAVGLCIGPDDWDLPNIAIGAGLVCWALLLIALLDDTLAKRWPTP
jgi:hypothetical protein